MKDFLNQRSAFFQLRQSVRVRREGASCAGALFSLHFYDGFMACRVCGLMVCYIYCYGGDGRDWLIVGIAGAWSYDVYGLHVAHDGKKEKKPLRAEWLVHELTDAGEEVWEKDAANKEALS